MRNDTKEGGEHITYIGHEIDPVEMLCHLINGELLEIPINDGT
jgi:hypothetical protein